MMRTEAVGWTEAAAELTGTTTGLFGLTLAAPAFCFAARPKSCDVAFGNVSFYLKNKHL